MISLRGRGPLAAYEGIGSRTEFPGSSPTTGRLIGRSVWCASSLLGGDGGEEGGEARHSERIARSPAPRCPCSAAGLLGRSSRSDASALLGKDSAEVGGDGRHSELIAKSPGPPCPCSAADGLLAGR